MVGRTHVGIYIILIFVRFHASFSSINLKSTEIKTGSEPNHCAAIIDRCRARCTNIDGKMEYVQMTIKLLDSKTTCNTTVTDPGELVPINPKNTNRQMIMFNVPCCQQQRVNDSCLNSNDTRILPTTPKLPLRDDAFIVSTSPATTETKTNLSSSAVSNSQSCNQTLALIEVVLLIFVILCFILLCLILGIVLKSRRRTNQKVITELPQATGNCYGGDATDASNQNGNVVNIAGSEVAFTKMEDTSPPSHYIELPNQSFPPAPKSARPSRGRQEGQPEEIIIVGAKNLMTSLTPSAPPMKDNVLMNAIDSSIRNGNVVERPKGTEKTEHNIVTYIKDNVPSPITFGTTGRLTSKGNLILGTPTDGYQNEELSRNRAQTDVTMSSWENSTVGQDDSIYNRLRSNKNDDAYNDYQRLLRQSQINQNSDVEDVTYDVTSSNTYDVVPVRNDADNDRQAKINKNGDVDDTLGLYDDVVPSSNANGGYTGKNFTLASKNPMYSNLKDIEDEGINLGQEVSEDVRNETESDSKLDSLATQVQKNVILQRLFSR